MFERYSDVISLDYEICLLTGKKKNSWDEFLLENQSATFFHQTGWKDAIENSYGHKSYYLFAAKDNVLLGVLPMFFLHNRLFGKRLISVPFAPYGGACSTIQDVDDALINDAIGIGKELGVDYCEFRYQGNSEDKISQYNYYSTFLLDLSQGKSYIWNNLNRKVRNIIRKGEKNNLEFRIDSAETSISEFYDVYLRNMKYLGTPVHSMSFFYNVFKAFREKVFIAKVLWKEKIISSLFLVNFKNSLTSCWGSSLRGFQDHAPNDYIYWNSIKFACDNNMHWFDFGRSPVNSGNYKFKKRWGSSEIPLIYSYFPHRTKLEPPHIKFNRFAIGWSYLPLTVTKIVGPKIRKFIP